MYTSPNGVKFIANWEGLRLKAYKALPTEKYYTIGYGHCGSDVKKDMEITKEQAESLLRRDLASSENAVNKLQRSFNQNQFDALVSFTYNCGPGNLRQLCKPERSLDDIGIKMLLYNKSGGKKIQGLVNRRMAEHKLYFE